MLELYGFLLAKLTAVIVGAILALAGIFIEHDKKKAYSKRIKVVVGGIGLSLVAGIYITFVEDNQKKAQAAKDKERFDATMEKLQTALDAQDQLKDRSEQQIESLDNLNSTARDLEGLQGKLVDEQDKLSAQSGKLRSQITQMNGLLEQSQQELLAQQQQFSQLFERMANPILPALAVVEVTFDYKSAIFDNTRKYVSGLLETDVDSKEEEPQYRTRLYSRNSQLNDPQFAYLHAESFCFVCTKGKSPIFYVKRFYIPNDVIESWSAPTFLANLSLELYLYAGFDFSGPYNRASRLRKIDTRLKKQSDVRLLLNRTALPSFYDKVPIYDLPPSPLVSKGIEDAYAIDLNEDEVSLTVVMDVSMGKSHMPNVSVLDLNNMLAEVHFHGIHSVSIELSQEEVIKAITKMSITLYTGQGHAQVNTFSFDSNNLDRLDKYASPALYAQGAS